jgi:4-aminobutyrate aminotransferase
VALERMSALREARALIGDVRGLGLLLGIELLRNRDPAQRACDEADRVMYRCLEKGLSFKLTMGNILTLTPPLTIRREELDRAFAILDTAIAELE